MEVSKVLKAFAPLKNMKNTKTRVLVIDEVSEVIDEVNRVCLQKVVYQYASGGSDEGYRFINRGFTTGNMKAQLGQCRLPDIELILRLVTAAKKKGWT